MLTSFPVFQPVRSCLCSQPMMIEGGGHIWTGMRSPAHTLGKSAMNISANDLMWEFFEKHPIT